MEKSDIRKAYIKHWLENGKRPSVYGLCKELNLDENSFYQQYSSTDTIDKDIWLSFFTETKEQLDQDETYKGYSAREKLLAFYFLWIQKLRANRSFLLLQRESFSFTEFGYPKLERFRDAFHEYARDIIRQAEEGHEIKARKYLSDQYPHGFWLQTLFVLNYWLKDESENFEMTDAAIEKAVNLSFMLLGESALEGIVDFGKFLLTKKRS